MSLPNIRVFIRPAGSFVADGNAVLGSTDLGLLINGGTPFILGPSSAAFVELSDTVTGCSIRRGRTRVTDTFEAGSATVVLVDKDGRFNPDSTTSDLYDPITSTSYVLPLRQFRIVADIDGDSYELFNGYSNRFTYDYQVGYDPTFVTIEAVDAFRILNISTVELLSTTAPGELSGTRISQILADLGVPSTLRDISAGNTTLTADDESLRTGLEAIQVIEATELGAFFMSASGKYIFRGRQDTQQLAGGLVTTPLVFDETSGIPFLAITQSFDDEQIYNKVTVTGSEINDQEVTDATSVTDFFLRSLVRSGTLLETDDEGLDMANLLLGSKRRPSLIIDSIGLSVTSLSIPNQVSVVQAELLDPITLTKDYAGTALQRTLTIQGVDHTITPNDWSMVLSLAEPLGGDALILDSATSGILDSNLVSY